MKNRRFEDNPPPLKLDEKDPRLDIHRENADLRQENAELKKQLRETTRLLHADTVTDAFNRRGIVHAFTHTMEGEQGALFLIDLDKFKPINDTFGHDAGDEALRMVSDTMQKLCRGNDIVGRLGGDEFIIILDNVDAIRAAERMQEFQKAFETMSIQAAPMDKTTGVQTVKIGGTIGVAPYQRGDNFETVYKAADANMFQLKKAKGPSIR
jgi:diguanylate cyclase (GGDEF)-like protein